MRTCAIDTQPAHLTHYVIVRSDLSVGLMVANTVHAAGESAGVPPGTYAVALATADQAHLEDVKAKLSKLGIPFSEIIESEGPHAGELMALGVKPLEDRSTIRKAVSSLPLVR
jgi:malonyl CoA-acyl carrier protein transacylase